MIGRLILTFTGPMVGQAMLFVVVNLLVFLSSLLLVMRIGSGKIAQPIFVISLGFLASALVPLVGGSGFLWLVPLIQSLFGLLGILLFMRVLGVFVLLSRKEAV